MAILCGFVLALAPLFGAQPAWCIAPAVHGCCHCGGKMACCAAQKNSAAPVSATVRSAPQNELSLLSQTLSIPTPLTAPAALSFVNAAALKPAALPIFARDCARLL